MKKNKLYRKLEGILYNYKNIQQEINNIKLEIHYIKNNFKGCGSIGYEERTGPTYKITSQVEDEIINKEKILEKLYKELNYKELLINKINNSLIVLSNKERELIRIRYIEGQGKVSWPIVAEQTYLSESRCYQLKDEIILKLIPIVFIGEL
ncbi:RNA polymerase subunit sigma [Clostridium botulinum]|uniref:RNA polymerase subunit sigma n=1 Tax=Clostridium botulinum TaxID=1491 RepID=UPI0013F0072D|nr:RNA polymerase subunit sigma [Clostridium botulinum]MBE1304550.1 RNA polymerase subunit sigma [Clostridium botulinum]NFC29220.1 RNA polymerase subunit sigma [Clostridium botulinum]NFC60546.1 RNA polymerase subunit sigma [Clostridium botulinum]NFC68554.1 RNA polymerase subunit sigma [Clostridium botulinum]NFE37169.1 RNA polymerase subunit sigma [Clostridium botulinum]